MKDSFVGMEESRGERDFRRSYESSEGGVTVMWRGRGFILFLAVEVGMGAYTSTTPVLCCDRIWGTHPACRSDGSYARVLSGFSM